MFVRFASKRNGGELLGTKNWVQKMKTLSLLLKACHRPVEQSNWLFLVGNGKIIFKTQKVGTFSAVTVLKWPMKRKQTRPTNFGISSDKQHLASSLTKIAGHCLVEIVW